MYYLDPDTCQWKTLKGQFANAIDWSDVQNKPIIYNGIKQDFNSDNITTTLNTENVQSSSVAVATIDDLNDVL